MSGLPITVREQAGELSAMIDSNPSRATLMAINWEAIATLVGDQNWDGNVKRGSGTESGRRALELLIGEENLREAVDYVISLEPGWDTAEMVIKIIRSRVAMRRCLEIYTTEPGTERACFSVFFLGSFADHAALPWIPGFLVDSDKIVRLNGLRVLQNILYEYDSLHDEQLGTAKQLLNKSLSDPDPTVRERAMEILAWLNGADPEQAETD
jgi:hypothetical protein